MVILKLSSVNSVTLLYLDYLHNRFVVILSMSNSLFCVLQTAGPVSCARSIFHV